MVDHRVTPARRHHPAPGEPASMVELEQHGTALH
jgi:hypothetical protein